MCDDIKSESIISRVKRFLRGERKISGYCERCGQKDFFLFK